MECEKNIWRDLPDNDVRSSDVLDGDGPYDTSECVITAAVLLRVHQVHVHVRPRGEGRQSLEKLGCGSAVEYNHDKLSNRLFRASGLHFP